MPVTKQFDLKVKKLRRKDWGDLKSFWLQYQDAARNPGVPPAYRFAELPSLRVAASGLKDQHPCDVGTEIEGLRPLVLKDALFRCQKAAYYLRSAKKCLEDQRANAALFLAYESAYYACKGLTALFGVIDFSIPGEKSSYLVDVFGEVAGGTRALGYTYFVRILSTEGYSVNHKESWHIFKRVVLGAKSELNASFQTILESLAVMEDEEFARQRNHIQYTENYWLFDDLLDCRMPEDFSRFGAIQNVVEVLKDLEGGPLDFSFALSEAAMQIIRVLLRDLSSLSGGFQAEFDLTTRWLERAAATCLKA